MLKSIKNYFRQRRERKLRKDLLYKLGFNSTTHAIAAWIDFILDGKATKELLLSTSERQRMEELRELSEACNK